MKVEVGYAYYEGGLRVWDTLYVPVKHTVPEEIVTETAIGKALVALESITRAASMLDHRELIVAGTWLHSIDNECVVECPECGSYEARLEMAATGSGDVFFPNLMIGEDGSVDDIYYNLDASGGRLTDKEVVRCERCGHRGTFAEFVDN
jgi:DNA-directed RNA polymerase subunit RPC12/RpoP